MQGFAFLLPASSAGARSLLVPGTCDLTPSRADARGTERQSRNSPDSRTRQHFHSIRRVRFSGSLCVDRSPHSRPLNRLFSSSAVPASKKSPSVPRTPWLLAVLSRPVSCTVCSHLCNSPEGKTPRGRKILYSLPHQELCNFRARRADRIPSRFVQHGP